MKKTIAIILAMLLCLTASAQVRAYDILKVNTPSNVCMYNETKITVELKDPINGTPLIGQANNISLFIQDGNGSYIINGTHPQEIADGIYYKKISITSQMGTYIIWATLEYNGKNYTDSDVFEIRWDIYDNMTALTYRMQDVISLVHWESQNSTMAIISHITSDKQMIYDTNVKTEQIGIFTQLQNTAISTLFSWLFMSILIVIVFTISTWLYGKRKGSRLAIQVANLPKTIAGYLTETG